MFAPSSTAGSALAGVDTSTQHLVEASLRRMPAADRARVMLRLASLPTAQRVATLRAMRNASVQPNGNGKVARRDARQFPLPTQHSRRPMGLRVDVWRTLRPRDRAAVACCAFAMDEGPRAALVESVNMLPPADRTIAIAKIRHALDAQQAAVAHEGL